jgi:hypothetical protein
MIDAVNCKVIADAKKSELIGCVRSGGFAKFFRAGDDGYPGIPSDGDGGGLREDSSIRIMQMRYFDGQLCPVRSREF